MPVRWMEDPLSVWTRGLNLYKGAMLQAIAAELEAAADEVESWMRENAPWTDQTGNARQALFARVVVDSMARMEFGHGVDYGIWLELANSGQYAIVSKALDYWGPRLVQRVKQRLGMR